MAPEPVCVGCTSAARQAAIEMVCTPFKSAPESYCMDATNKFDTKKTSRAAYVWCRWIGLLQTVRRLKSQHIHPVRNLSDVVHVNPNGNGNVTASNNVQAKHTRCHGRDESHREDGEHKLQQLNMHAVIPPTCGSACTGTYTAQTSMRAHSTHVHPAWSARDVSWRAIRHRFAHVRHN
jgi:hypothetical protein